MRRRSLPTVAIVASLMIMAMTNPAQAQNLAWKDLTIPVTFSAPGGSQRLDLTALLIYPDDGLRHPLAVISHGSPRDRAAYRDVTPYSLYSQAAEFARRGWAAVVVLGRGYGTSGSDGGDRVGPCQARDYLAEGRYSADDIRQAIRGLATLPGIDASRVLAVGVSAGGFASIALAAEPPPGLVAVISFAGGRGSSAPDHICNAPALIEAFRSFGQSARVPMLWVYAENDHFFGPDLAHRLQDAFTAGDGRVDFIQAPPFGDDGHSLFSAQGIPLWTPYVDSFLAGHGLGLRARPIDLPAPQVAPPPPLADNGREAFRTYLSGPPHKAFALSPEGAFGWRTGRATLGAAEQDALDSCQKHATNPCRVIRADNQPVP